MSTDYGTKYKTARERLLDLLSDLQWHSWRELKGTAGVRYSARLLELKRQGYQIEDDSEEEDGKRYLLASLEPGEPQGKKVKIYLSEKDVLELLAGQLTATAEDSMKDALRSFQANRGKL